MSVKNESEKGWISQEAKMTSSSLSTVIVFHSHAGKTPRAPASHNKTPPRVLFAE